MYPVLFQCGGFSVYSYGLILAIGVGCSLYLLLQQARRKGYNQDVILDLAFVILLSGIIGARLLYIILNIDFYLENPIEIIMLHHGGLAIFGGFLLAIISTAIYLRRKNASFLEMVDLFSPFVALAHSIGRIGCFFNGCCYGLISKFGIYFPSHNATLIPAQLISSFLLLLLFVYLRILQSKNEIPGKVFASYLMLYSLIRFCLEFIRADSLRIYFGLTIFQLFSIALFVLGLSFHFWLKLQSNKFKERSN